MKKMKRVVAALMSAAMTVTASANIIAYADVDSGNRAELEERLEGYGHPYSRIEDASGIDVKDYSLSEGAVYYVNEKGQVMAVKTIKPDHISIIMNSDADENKLDESIADVMNGVKVEKGIGYNAEGEKIKEIVISPETGDELPVEKARELFEAIKDDVISCDYYSALYMVGHPQYSWRADSTGTNRHHFTSYYDSNDKKDEIQAVIDENNLPCHIEELSDTYIDVVVDVQMSYPEEIAIASMITNATGAKCSWVVPENTGGTLGGSKINMYNFEYDEKVTDTAKAMELFNKYFEENNFEAVCVTSEEYPSYYPPLVVEYVVGSVTGKQIVEFAESNNIEHTLFKNVPIINGEKVYYVEADIKVKGDANCDYSADMADVVLVMQALANPDKYGENGTADIHLTAKGKNNADLNGDGLTVGDAQAIQNMLLGK